MTAATEKLPLRERAQAAYAEALAESERRNRERAEEERESRRKTILDWVTGNDITLEDIECVEDDGTGESAIAVIDGMRFQVRKHYERWDLYAQLPCSVSNCTNFTRWLNLGRDKNNELSVLGSLLADPLRMCEECLKGTQVDDSEPAAAPQTSAPDNPAIAAIEAAGDRLAQATEREQELQALRGIRKDEAVRRVMSARGLAATPAEKIVEEDAEYYAFLKDCRSAVADRIKAEARYEAEKLRAYLAVRTEVALS